MVEDSTEGLAGGASAEKPSLYSQIMGVINPTVSAATQGYQVYQALKNGTTSPHEQIARQSNPIPSINQNGGAVPVGFFAKYKTWIFVGVGVVVVGGIAWMFGRKKKG